MVVFTTSTRFTLEDPPHLMRTHRYFTLTLRCSGVKAAEMNCMKTHVHAQMDALLQLQRMFSLLRRATDTASVPELELPFKQEASLWRITELVGIISPVSVISSDHKVWRWSRIPETFMLKVFFQQSAWLNWIFHKVKLLKGAWADRRTANCGFGLWYWSIPYSSLSYITPGGNYIPACFALFWWGLRADRGQVDSFWRSRRDFWISSVKIYLLTDFYIWDEWFCVTKQTVYTWGVFSNVNYFCRKIKKSYYWRTLVTWLGVITEDGWRWLFCSRS